MLIIACPNCQTEYEIDASLVPSTGRSVQCSNCHTVWTAMPETPLMLMNDLHKVNNVVQMDMARQQEKGQSEEGSLEERLGALENRLGHSEEKSPNEPAKEMKSTGSIYAQLAQEDEVNIQDDVVSSKGDSSAIDDADLIGMLPMDNGADDDVNLETSPLPDETVLDVQGLYEDENAQNNASVEKQDEVAEEEKSIFGGVNESVEEMIPPEIQPDLSATNEKAEFDEVATEANIKNAVERLSEQVRRPLPDGEAALEEEAQEAKREFEQEAVGAEDEPLGTHKETVDEDVEDAVIFNEDNEDEALSEEARLAAEEQEARAIAAAAKIRRRKKAKLAAAQQQSLAEEAKASEELRADADEKPQKKRRKKSADEPKEQAKSDQNQRDAKSAAKKEVVAAPKATDDKAQMPTKRSAKGKDQDKDNKQENLLEEKKTSNSKVLNELEEMQENLPDADIEKAAVEHKVAKSSSAGAKFWSGFLYVLMFFVILFALRYLSEPLTSWLPALEPYVNQYSALFDQTLAQLRAMVS